MGVKISAMKEMMMVVGKIVKRSIYIYQANFHALSYLRDPKWSELKPSWSKQNSTKRNGTKLG